jgi:hypothetical protein
MTVSRYEQPQDDYFTSALSVDLVRVAAGRANANIGRQVSPSRLGRDLPMQCEVRDIALYLRPRTQSHHLTTDAHAGHC